MDCQDTDQTSRIIFAEGTSFCRFFYFHEMYTIVALVLMVFIDMTSGTDEKGIL